MNNKPPCTYMIHACNNRKWYVEQYLIPSLLLQGIDLDHIILWLDKDKQGCLYSCMNAFKSLEDKEGCTWHLQDDIIICSNFKQKTEEYQDAAAVVCGYCYNRLKGQPEGSVQPADMWYSFPCIKIDNELAAAAANWFFKTGRYEPKYTKFVSTGKYDDTMFKVYLEEFYKDDYIVYNLKPNIVDHVDYLIGGSIANKYRDQIRASTPAAFFEEPEKVEELKKILNEKKDLKVAAYCGTRNLYKDMVPAFKSLLVNSDVDKIYLIIEDDEFPYPLPPEVETINVSNQGFFRKNGPNMKSKFTYMAMMRAALAYLLPQHDKVLSLDIDTIAVQDISDLWDIDLKNNYFAACTEPERCIGGKYHNEGDPRLYYNIGVTMYNLKELRKGKAMEVIELLNNKRYTFVEQDCMNILCEGCTASLANDYNCCKYSSQQWCGRSFDPKIIHFAGIPDWAEKDYPEVKMYRDMKITDGKGNVF